MPLFAIATIALLGGCAPSPPPEVLFLTGSSGRCGDVQIVVIANGSGYDELELVAAHDSIYVGGWTPAGIQGLAVRAHAEGPTAHLAATLADSHVTFEVPMLPIDATVDAQATAEQFAPLTPGRVAITASTPCTANPEYYGIVRVPDDDRNVTQGVLDADGTTWLVSPPVKDGLYDVTIELTDGDHVLATDQVALYWGEDRANDQDGDGHAPPRDCDDRDHFVSRDQDEATEANGKDDNCDGRVDEGTTAYDDDGDGQSEDQGDCDDADASVRAGIAEVGDCRDQDCDGQIDEGVSVPDTDDGYEPNDTLDHAYNLETSRKHSFTKRLDLVTRDGSDDAWFKFFSQDGDWDEWGIFVVVERVPTGSTYLVELYGEGSTPLSSERISASHGGIELRGRPFGDDGGNYLLRVHPVTIARPWCPVTVALSSR